MQLWRRSQGTRRRCCIVRRCWWLSNRSRQAPRFFLPSTLLSISLMPDRPCGNLNQSTCMLLALHRP